MCVTAAASLRAVSTADVVRRVTHLYDILMILHRLLTVIRSRHASYGNSVSYDDVYLSSTLSTPSVTENHLTDVFGASKIINDILKRGRPSSAKY
jgi:hypothetical protein